MPFEYFNNSHLAFGSKLTKAFRQLEKLCNDSERNMQSFAEIINYLGQYRNRNYRVAIPNSPDDAVRSDEIFDLVNDEIIIKDLSFKDNKLNMAVNYFDRSTYRFTIGQGSTDLKEGYAFMSKSVSNSNPTSEIQFVSDKSKGNGMLLLRYRVDASNNINIVYDEDALLTFKRGGIKHIRNLTLGEQITLPYTATDYEAILVEGIMAFDGPSVNIGTEGESIRIQTGGTNLKRYAMVYLKPGETLKPYSETGNVWKVIYS